MGDKGNRIMVMGDKNDNNNNFFFFQAEDGIRDIGVTGVQTCALPISYQPYLYVFYF